MRLRQICDALCSIALVLTSSKSIAAAKSPNVDVSLRASFPSPHFFYELLEAAAQENSSSYFPVLQQYNEHAFHDVWDSDFLLFTRFGDELESGEHLNSAAARASWEFAVGIRAGAPRVEAAFQFWRTAVVPSLRAEGNRRENLNLLMFKRGGILCGDAECNLQMKVDNATITHSDRNLQFDHVFGDASSPDLLTIYVDLAAADFAENYGTFLNNLIFANQPFRLRYKPRPGPRSRAKPFYVQGYGVELALKRTDYIVIDDRQEGDAKPAQPSAPASNILLDDAEEEIIDVKPLSKDELSQIGHKTANFVLSSEDPFGTLLRVSQDFPKHAASLAAAPNASAEFVAEHMSNREIMVPPGYNIMWINGVQVNSREFDPFHLLEQMRRERKVVTDITQLGFTAAEAIAILTHEEVSKVQLSSEPQRYDYRDEDEGGNLIIWLNNIEKDKRYADWPTKIGTLLQRTYPGQLPQVRKNIHNVVFPVDFTDPKDLQLVLEQLQVLVQRGLAIQFGIVPKITTPAALEQAKVVYHLTRVYGLRATIEYLTNCASDGKKAHPSEAAFNGAIAEKATRNEQKPLKFVEVASDTELSEKIENLKGYLNRLDAGGENPPIFGNGMPISYNDDWMQLMGQRISDDLRVVQELVYMEKLTQEQWIPEIWLKNASRTRNSMIIPEDETNVKLFNVEDVYRANGDALPNLRSGEVVATAFREVMGLVVVANLASSQGISLVLEAMKFQEKHNTVALVVVNNLKSARDSPEEKAEHDTILGIYKDMTDAKWIAQLQAMEDKHFGPQAEDTSLLVQKLKLKPGESGVYFNGRLVGPIPEGRNLQADDYETLMKYEKKKRIDPVVSAVLDLGLSSKLDENPLATIELSALVALASVSGVPEGIFDNSPAARMSEFNKWSGKYTAIEINADAKENAYCQIVASIDPASETAQGWLPTINVLTKLAGVHAKIYLNPLDTVNELPVKRFYRQVLHHEPGFDSETAFSVSGASFSGIPSETLLTMNMDVPPAWLVAPRESIHDLDNLKLSSLKDSTSVEAVYALENILIEGHSRDTSQANQPPRGAQLLLSTEGKPNVGDTIIMANLGYFQFKANPGVYNMTLRPGRSQQIFSIDSAGAQGFSEVPGDDTTEVTLTSFLGTTLYPRLSRKPGMESEDVLEATPSAAESIATKGAEIAEELLAKAGLGNLGAADYIVKGAAGVQNILAKAGFGSASDAAEKRKEAKKPADVNIFSVASGHLYERMLNIMMVSVMRHTNSTVKFWFIEQFLSPSFKRFLPHLAAEYGFTYELVTYKWPHWLRAQHEKQRVIWGYKILFLDVLFPLDLDKVIFVDADQIVRTDMQDLVRHDLEGAPYGFTPMCDSRTEMEGFRFWKQGYWKNFLRGLPYHISALYVVDLRRFRALAAGDRLRGQYHQLSADPNSLANLDQDLPNHMQMQIPIHSLPQEWLWCETWCSDEQLKSARTIDLCNNPMTKEPKLDRARRQVPEWTEYDEEIAALAKRVEQGGKGGENGVVSKKAGASRVSVPSPPPVQPNAGAGEDKEDEAGRAGAGEHGVRDEL